MNCHLKDFHGEFLDPEKKQRHNCQLCDFSTSVADRFKRHLTFHRDERPYASTFPGCSYRSKRNDSLKNHTVSLHIREIHHCPVLGCNYVAKNKVFLLRHRKVHNKPFPCVFPGCTSQFYSEVALLNHQRMHDPSRKFQCDYCSQRFLIKSKMQRHIDCAHAEVKHSCPRCNMTWSYKRGLRDHMKKVHPEEKFSCQEPGCSYANFSQEAVSAHEQRAHDKTRPFKCQYCAFRMSKKDYLRRNLKNCPRNPTLTKNRTSGSDFPTRSTHFKCKLGYCTFLESEKLIQHSVLHPVPTVTLTRLDVVFR